MAAEKKKAGRHDLAAEEQQLTDWQRLAANIQENPKPYAIGAVLVAICILATVLYKVQATRADRAVSTEYATAILEVDEPAEKTSALANVLDEGAGRWTPEVIYMMGETAIEAKEYDKARAAFSRVRQEFPQSEYTPRAAEGIAFLEENAGNYDAALQAYQEVRDKWPDTLTGKRQPLNIARVYTSMDRLEDAIAAYKEQAQIFPDSAAAQMAQGELERLKQKHPDLFPEEPVAEAAEAAEENTEEAAATAEESAEETAPASEEAAPSAEDTAPAVEEAAPASEEPVPAAEESAEQPSTENQPQ